MDLKDFLSVVQTCYILPGDHLVFVTPRDLTKAEVDSFYEFFQTEFADQRVALATNISHVLIQRKPLLGQTANDGASSNGTTSGSGVKAAEAPCHCVSDCCN